ncbi:hypothetical protein D0C36_19255 [Mucilaginibacter conchicola]|uniref:Plasmid transfer protein n=1 Tax=Mucilaginibacter conchicola TaxID=2303333 RepID=A0A372NQ82_9SPHI|nr:hypothetical protein [Mucilaginibacter conchicola]RFZ91082.1 hypothetical protein D0C36_19255 [Mucilaginibacter conchicola]
MKTVILLLCMTLFSLSGICQRNTINIIGIHQLVSESISENKLQAKAKNQQALNTANEQANLTQLARLKAVYRTIQQRYNTLGTAIDAAQIGFYGSPMVSRIISNERQIVEMAERNPALAAIGYPAAIQFAVKARSLLTYVAGLTLSIGDINQMKPSDRKLLFDFVLSELSTIQDLSGNMLGMMQNAGLSNLIRGANPFQNFIDADKDIAAEIIRNAKYIRK